MEKDSKPPQQKSPNKVMLWIIAGIAVLGVLKASGVISGLPGGPC